MRDTILSMAALAMLAGCAAPPTKTFGGTVTGSVLGADLQPAPLVTVYLVDEASAEKSDAGDALTGSNGRFRLDAPAGRWTLIATDFQSNAGFVYSIEVRDGDVVDVGSLFLQPCAMPGTTPDGALYEECPSLNDGAAPGYGTPPAAEQAIELVPDYTDATVTTGSPPIVDATVTAGRWQLTFQISSPTYQSPGTYSVAYGAGFDAWLYDTELAIFYLFSNGTLVVEALEPVDGGQLRVRLRDAVFSWHDAPQNETNAGYTVFVSDTDPAMTDTLDAIAPSEAGGSPPPSDVVVPLFTPDFVQAYRNADGSVSLGSVQSFENGDLLELYLEVPPALNTVGTHEVSNAYGEDASDWEVAMSGRAVWYDATGQYEYLLESLTLAVSDPATSDGDTFAATIGDVLFLWQPGGQSQPDTTLTLTIDTSGTIAGAAVSGDDDPSVGRLDWLELKDELLVNLGG